MTTQAIRPRQAYRTARVTAIRRLGSRMIRVTFTGADLGDFVSVAPDQYVKVFFPSPGSRVPLLPPPLLDDPRSWYRAYLAMPDGARSPMRTYTIRTHRPDVCEVDIDFVLHPHSGPASSWTATTEPGDEVVLLGPYGRYAVPHGTRWQLLVGDESALPAIGAIVESLPDGATTRVLIEVADTDDELPLMSLGDVDVRWVHRRGASPGEAVLAALRAADLPGGRPYAWVSGEADLVKFTRRHLVRERGMDKRAITFTGYWRRGQSEDAATRDNLRRIDAGRPLIDD